MATAMAPSSSSATSFLLLSFTLSLSLLSFTSAATSTDTISAQHSLTGNQTITSADGTFVLGFFTPPGSGGNYYIGIWYGKIFVLTSVWVANRVTPVTDPTTSELKISDDGNLVLLDQFKSIIWSTNVTAISSPNSTVVAVILDDGNLQLRDGSNSSLIFWQSFDHPTDTWLPGAKLGFNKITKSSQRLTSWKNKVDPSPGIFTYGMDPTGRLQYLFLWNLSRIYWASGMWNGHEFSSVTESPSNYRDNMQVVNHTDEIYLTYTGDANRPTVRLVLDYDSGQVQALAWTEISKSWMLFWTRPRSKCTVYGVCGPFGSCSDFTSPFCNCVKGFRIKSQTDWDLGDRSQGCERKTALQCSGLNNNSADSEKDGFFEMTNVRLPDIPDTLATAGSREGCELACSSNCSCNAYSYNDSGCFVWHGGLLNLQEQYNQSDAGTLYLRLAASEFQTSESNKKRMVAHISIGVVVPAVVVCLFIIGSLLWKRERRRAIQNSKVVQNSLVSFMYDELRIATKNFSEKLGGGGFGSVFKGSLPGSIDIAVKQLEGLHQGEKQFRAEVSTLGAIQHVNLIRLIGFCSQRSKKLLVYEFMPSGSLADQLFRSNSNVLDWKTRYGIAIGIARGLAYLHEQCRDNIIHCDIKPENILLNDALVPKVADFGLAKLFGRNFSKVLTTIRGSRGYIAPEWISGMPITTKVDVYSYGMMLFEIISGKRNLICKGESSFEFFPLVATNKLIIGDVKSLLDQRLEGKANSEEFEIACKLACWCIQDDESSRPTMSQIVQALEGNLDVGIPPVPRSFKVLNES
ncbi:G-type lectin S-receptor-like serine/threonine-protein kinase At2g19130 [Curcuma longa]|uniref:G-type lectin S-receptor-like serine/threonine-protein kinase At2g19130 n=1 Tax=Curcuma longa TaxID=136217 RepID=UPI003D9ED259